jgi:hypothetical protein
LRPVKVPALWSHDLSTIQNICRLYAILATFMHGFLRSVAPRATSHFFGMSFVPSGLGLAFSCFSAAMMMGCSAFLISTTDKIVLRNFVLLAAALWSSVILLHPAGAFPALYVYIFLNIISALAFHNPEISVDFKK